MASRRVAVVLLPALLIVGALLTVLPASAGSIRVAGVSLTWWYAIVLAPAVATVLGPPGDVRSLLLCASPALVVPLATQVFTAAPAAPLVAMAAVIAPRFASLVRRPDVPALPRPLTAGLLTAAVVLMVWANFAIVGDVARGVGGERWHALALTAPVAVALAWLPDVRWRPRMFIASVALLAIVLVAVAVATSVTPWRAWSRLASRPLVAFTERSPWVEPGRTLVAPTSVMLPEAQRITATTAAIVRVVADDGGGPAAHERLLAPGDSLALQSGDQVLLPAGAGVRFESGRRVPGAPPSGVAWADATAHGAFGGLLVATGAALTLVGGGAVLLAPSTATTAASSRVAWPALALGIVLVAVCWGVYGADVGPDLALGAPASAAFVRLPSVAASGVWGSTLGVLTVVAIVGLLATAATALADRAAVAWYPDRRATRNARALRVGVVLAAAALALVPATPWNVLMLGFGLAAAGLGPTLVDVPAHARLVASVTGTSAIAVTAIAGSWLAPVLAEYPALVAAPLAATAGWIVAGRS
ncbi:MAG: hypothetical protein DMD91_14280 [Candidatus Rokuibacteriota bacterium]|nr:MAG: hypothetical protein DMD91_14280 [Candidatus Rokubacteria bacterium]